MRMIAQKKLQIPTYIQYFPDCFVLFLFFFSLKILFSSEKSRVKINNVRAYNFYANERTFRNSGKYDLVQKKRRKKKKQKQSLSFERNLDRQNSTKIPIMSMVQLLSSVIYFKRFYTQVAFSYCPLFSTRYSYVFRCHTVNMLFDYLYLHTQYVYIYYTKHTHRYDESRKKRQGSSVFLCYFHLFPTEL